MKSSTPVDSSFSFTRGAISPTATNRLARTSGISPTHVATSGASDRQDSFASKMASILARIFSAAFIDGLPILTILRWPLPSLN